MNNKVKVIQICAIDSTMDILLKELNKIALKEGFDVIGICSQGEKTKSLKKEGFKIINVNIDRGIKPISNIKTILNIYKVLKKERPEIVHVHTPVAAVLGRIAAKAAKVPIVIYTAHGFYFHENMKSMAYKICFFIEKFMGKFFTDYIFTQSEEDANVAKKNNFNKEDRILAIGNGVDIFGKFNTEIINETEINKLKQEFSINENDIVISFVGRMVREKGILDLLEAFNNLNKKNIKLLVIGDRYQGDRDESCKECINNFKENKNIIFTGKRSDINNLLYISDIFCLPSYREGMPRSIIEAMAMQCAVIATNIRGSREEVVDGKTGFLVPLNSPSSIQDRIQQLIDDKDLLSLMKITGRKRAEKLYDEKKVVYKQLEIFEELLVEKEFKNVVRKYNY